MKKTLIQFLSLSILLTVLNFLFKLYNLPYRGRIFYLSLLIIIALTIYKAVKLKRKHIVLLIGIIILPIHSILNGIVYKSMNWGNSIFYPRETITLNSIRSKSISKNFLESRSSIGTLDTTSLNQVIDEVIKYNYLKSLIIIKNQKLIHEGYFNGATKSDAFNMMSATKSFTSALVGIAIREGYIKDINESLYDYFPEYFENNRNKEKRNITIKDLLTMQAGYSFHSTRNIFKGLNWSKSIINYSLEFEPHTHFCYAACESHLLMEIIARASQMSTKEFADEFLFTPLEINPTYWIKTPKGVNTGNAGLFLTTRDMAKFGLLYLNEGKYNNNQIIPANWIDSSFYNYALNLPRCQESEIVPFNGYGFQWWIKEFNNTITYTALGYGGQFIMIIPSSDMVIVTNSTRDVSWTETKRNVDKTINAIAKIIEITKDN